MNQTFTPFRVPGEIYAQGVWCFKLEIYHSIIARILGFPKSPFDLDQVCSWMGLSGWQDFGIASIDLNHVVGAKRGGHEFDRAFRPKDAKCLRADWEYWVVALLTKVQLPEMYFYQWGEAFFVPDRLTGILVSVMKAVRIRAIEARVLNPVNSEVPPPTIEYLGYWERKVNE